MTKGDKYQKEILQRILDEGCLDKNPRPVYADGTPAHTLSVNHGMCTYDLTKNDSEHYVNSYSDGHYYMGKKTKSFSNTKTNRC